MIKKFWPFLFFIFLIFLVFHPTFFLGRLPFPGDLILSEYAPWRQSSYFGYAPGAIPTKAQYFDVIRELYPWKTLVINELKSGRWPLWNPYNFSGTPLLANFQSTVFYPGNIFYFLLPQPIAWTVLVILQSFLSLIFTYLFARTLKLSQISSSLTAILYTFSSFQIVWSEFNTVGHTLLWLPLLLTLIEYSISQLLLPQHYLLWIFALFSSLTSGHPQDTLYVLIFLSTYTIWRLSTSPLPQAAKLTKLTKLLIPSLLTVGLASIQLLPTIELFLSSARSPHNPKLIITQLLLQPYQLIMFFIQDFFGNPATRSYLLTDTYIIKTVSIGSLGFIFFLLGLTIKNKPPVFRFFSYLSVITSLLLFRYPLSELFYRLPIPLLSTGTPTRLASLFTFSAAIIAGFGLESWLQNKLALKKFIFLTIFLLTIAWVYYLLANSLHWFSPPPLTTVKRALLLTTLILSCGLLCVYVKRISTKSVYILLIIVSLELSYSYLKFNSFVPINYIFPPNQVFTFLKSLSGIDRFWGYGTGRIEANFATQYQLFSPDGTDPFNLKTYNNFLNSNSRGDVGIPPGFGPTDLPQNQKRLRFLDLLGVKYILDRFENPKDNTTFPGNRYRKIKEVEGWTIYENLLSAPRYFLTTDFIKSPRENIKTLLMSPDFKPQSQIIIPSDINISSELKSDPASEIKLISYLPTQVKFQVRSQTPQLLYLSDVFAPGWSASVDNKPTSIIPANLIFRSVLIPPGSHTIIFSYFPNSFRYGLIITVISLILIITMFVTRKLLGRNLF